MSDAPPLLVSRDPGLVEVVTASAAAVGQAINVVRDPDELRRAWRTAPAVLIGGDSAEYVLALGFGPRSGVHLVGTQLREMANWSVALTASVVPLPDSAGILAGLLQQHNQTQSGGSAVWITGAGGGLGCSTFAAALAAFLALSLRTAVVELDPSGGIDLICGAEQMPGWRWPELSGAAGQLDDLSGRVPNVAGVDLVTVGREYHVVTPEAVNAVVGSLRRTHDVVVLDGGHDRPQLVGVQTILVAGADVRSVAAARANGSFRGLEDADLVVRTGVGRRIQPTLVAETLGLPLLGALPTDSAVPRAMEAGRMPGTGRGRYRRAIGRIAGELGC